MRLMDRLLKQNRKVIDDCIAAPNLLHELAAHAQHHPAEMLRLATAEDRLQRRAFSTCVARSADTVHDDLLLQLRFPIIAFQATQSRDYCLAFFIALTGEKPARRFREPDHAEDEDESENDLESDWEAPGEVWGAVACAVVDPVGYQCPEGDDAAFDADEEPSITRP